MKKFFDDFFPKERKVRIFWMLIIFLAFMLGWIIRTGDGNDQSPLTTIPAESETEAALWTCSMHPQIQQPKAGKCPLCGMDLIPVRRDGGSENTSQISLSENARRLAGVEVAPVEKRWVENEIRMVGKIEYDETRLRDITARVSGRIDRLYVNFTGIQVREGDHLAEIYSPELLSTQQELIASIRTLNSLSGGELPEMKQLVEQQLQSIRERLRLWGITNEQILQLEQNQNPSDHMTLYSSISGIVLEKNALEGTYVETGTRIYTIADLSRVWVKMDAYESDLPWLRYGQEAEFTAETFPGEVFTGRIAFIDPVINTLTRTAKVRVNIENQQGKLKPEMFVRGRVKSKMAASGKIMDPDLAGKWISPMHPEIIKNQPGSCDVCGMPLVRAEDLGYISVSRLAREAPLVIPATAPLITGKRAVVYVAIPGEAGTYEGREIGLGPRAGDYYIVMSGLREGEQVVVKGNFKIDSAIQIQAGKSMMNPQGDVAGSGHAHSAPVPPRQQLASTLPYRIPAELATQLDSSYALYFDIQHALSHDNFAPVKSRATEFLAIIAKVDPASLDSEPRQHWEKISAELARSASSLTRSGDIHQARAAFEGVSNAVIAAARTFSSNRHRLLVYHCPMAFDNRGADWLQNKEGTENPYFGSAMFTCGEQTADLSAAGLNQNRDGHVHE